MSDRLGDSPVGILCLTKENLGSRWLHFEAGALAKTKEALACTLLLNLKPADVTDPLAQLQHTVFEKDDVERLVTEEILEIVRRLDRRRATSWSSAQVLRGSKTDEYPEPHLFLSYHSKKDELDTELASLEKAWQAYQKRYKHLDTPLVLFSHRSEKDEAGALADAAESAREETEDEEEA